MNQKPMNMKTPTVITLAFSILLLSSCGAPDANAPGATDDATNGAIPPDTTATQADDDAVAYACPMHPEVTGKQGDTCSKCGMDLEKVE